MNTLSIIAAAAAATLAVAAPASAQVAFGGDGLYGHDYAASRVTSPTRTTTPTERAMSFGYASNTDQASKVQRSTPAGQLRPARPSVAGPQGVVPVQASVPNAY